ncbi:pre B cell leukemia transcription factor 1 [Brachionus plicatilis]|uniref:Pre B cell leukemia transcription factor 1 n=1 Tax=Brachionus plicatilis TaxID=10195 RepID=A0A3M7TAK0_BRAPC|nr:pre B cell leukemia transcription factor 1 [Brachionus plicatilis]
MNQTTSPINQSFSEEINQGYSYYTQGTSWYDYTANNSQYSNQLSSPSVITSSPQSFNSYYSPQHPYYTYYSNYYPNSSYYNNFYTNSFSYTTSDNSLTNESSSFSSNSESLKVSPLENNFENNFSPEKNISKRSLRKQLLPDSAVDIMNEWFDDHFNNPYPTMEEKERMAKQGGITVKQVTAWFSNRRNRSQNTKPKRIRRAIEQEMNIMINEFTYNPNKTEIIQKLKTLF